MVKLAVVKLAVVKRVECQAERRSPGSLSAAREKLDSIGEALDQETTHQESFSGTQLEQATWQSREV